MKKKMQTNAVTCWLEGWLSQRNPIENKDNIILDDFLVTEDQIKHLRKN